MKNIVILILSAIILYSVFFFKNEIKNNKAEYLLNTQALTENVKEVKNKLGENAYKVTTLESDNTDLIEQLKSNDSTVIRLQELISVYKKEIKNSGSVTVFNESITIKDNTPIEKTDSTTTFNYSNKWISLDGSIKDSLTFNLSIINKYSVIIGYESNGFFKNKTPYSLITNENPYSIVTSIKSYKVKVKKPKWSFGVTAGYGVVQSNSKLHGGFGVMLGMQYKLL
jgi:uncharacterized protein YxeA